MQQWWTTGWGRWAWGAPLVSGADFFWTLVGPLAVLCLRGDEHETAVMLARLGKALSWFGDLQMNTKGLILYTLHIQPHYVFGTKRLSSPSPLLFLGAEQCFWAIETQHGAVERKHASWFYRFVFLNSARGDEQRLDAKTRQRVIFLKSLNIRPLKTGFQHFSICGCLFFSCQRLSSEMPALPGWCLACRNMLWGWSWIPVSACIPSSGSTWSVADSWEKHPGKVIQHFGESHCKKWFLSNWFFILLGIII